MATISQRRGISVIIPDFLYLGSEIEARDTALLDSINITHVLSCAAQVDPSSLPFVAQDPRKVAVLWAAINDRDEALAPHLERTVPFMIDAEKKGSKVFVFCEHGKSRSVSIIIAFLMMHRNLSFSVALEQIRRTRPGAEPNAYFARQLRDMNVGDQSPAPVALAGDFRLSVTGTRSSSDSQGGGGPSGNPLSLGLPRPTSFQIFGDGGTPGSLNLTPAVTPAQNSLSPGTKRGDTPDSV